MASDTTRPRLQMAVARRPKAVIKLSTPGDLEDPSKRDDGLAHRLATALNLNNPTVFVKPSIKGKQKEAQPKEILDEKRRLAMGAANAASQSLGVVVRSGWKASNPDATRGCNKGTVMSYVSSFKAAISLLRELMPLAVEVEQVVSSFIGKLIAAQTHDIALELLDELRTNVIRIYHEPPSNAVLMPAGQMSTKPQLPPHPPYLHLIRYPTPPPEDAALLGIIGMSLAQAISSLATLVCQSHTRDQEVGTFVSAFEGDHGILAWSSLLPEEQADLMLTRAYRTLTMTFSNIPPGMHFRLRTLALRCLLHKLALESDSFWSQATNYLRSYGNSVTEAEECSRIVDGAVRLFNDLVTIAQGRRDASTFMSSPSFIKFCEVALMFAQRGDLSDVKRIARFINNDVRTVSNCDLSILQLHAIFSQGVSMLQKLLNTDHKDDVVPVLAQCAKALPVTPAIFSGLEPTSNTERSFEKLRRLCGQVLEGVNGDVELESVVKLVLEGIIESIEIAERQLSVKAVFDLVSCAVDSLCTLARLGLSFAKPETHQIIYGYLQRAVAIVDARQKLISCNNLGSDRLVTLARAMSCISGAFWNPAIALYQDNMYAAATRFLVRSCELGVRSCEMVRTEGASNGGSGSAPAGDTWAVLAAHLPKRWELLGDCYLKIGDRKLAHEAFIESLKAYFFEPLRCSSASVSPSQISLDPTYRRLSSLVERVTHIAVFELLIPDKTSLRHLLGASGIALEAVGLLLEWQINGLEETLWKSESRSVVAILLQDVLDVYGTQFPVRRARVLLRQLEIAYRTDDISSPTTDIAAEIHTLLSGPPDAGEDTALAHYRTQYRAATHMWVAFHTHRRLERQSDAGAIIFQQATLASKLLRGLFPTIPPLPRKSPKRSPQATKMATRTSPRKKPTAKPSPVTPKPRKKVMHTPSRVETQASSPKSTIKSSTLAVDPILPSTVEMIAQLLGLLGHIPLRIQFLNILQRMTEHSPQPSVDQFINASVEAAAEYLDLGKVQRALVIYAHALAAVNDATPPSISDEVRVELLLHYAEALALSGNENKSTRLYKEACSLSQSIECSQPKSTAGRIRARVQILVRSARASKVFSLIQAAKDDPHEALSSLRQSLRLWNRAFDSLSRLSPPQDPVEPNPFNMSSLRAVLPESSHTQKKKSLNQRTYRRRTIADTLQWRIAKGLLYTLHDLARAYFQQGSVRGAEYFIDQAHDLAQSINSPTMVSRALARRGELQLHQGSIREAATSLMEAAELLNDLPGVDAADITRLRAHHSQLVEQDSEAKTLYLQAMSMVSELDKTLLSIDSALPGPRKSLTQSPGRSSDPDVLASDFLAMILRQQIWLQRNEPRSKTRELLERLSALPPSRQTKAEQLATLAKLALHDAHIQFRADLFLSSLTESTIAIPLGLKSHDVRNLSAGAKQTVETLSTAETMFWENLGYVSNRGQALHTREAAVSLALIRFFQTSLGKCCNHDARVAVRLLDASAAFTLRRELIDAIDQKFPDLAADDLVWPGASGVIHVRQEMNPDGADNDDNSTSDLKEYWNSVRTRYRSDHGLDRFVVTGQVDLLPANWTVINIGITEDKRTMFFARQRPNREPLLFCVPLERHSRKDEDVEEQFTFNDAMQQLEEILRQSDQSAKDAKEVPPEDRDAKAAWWAKRVSLDKRMRGLLDNIEFCWLGAFKTIFYEPIKTPSDMLSSLRSRFDKIFHRTLVSDKKRASRMKLDDDLIECFASLSPKCRDEELEDLVYFVLDLYQFHGLHIALSDIDIDQVTAELRTALEEHTTKGKGRVEPVKDAHLFLVLDKNVQGIPWESIPVLRGRSVSRIPSLSFLVDRIELVKVQREMAGSSITDGSPPDRSVVNPKNTYYVLNPSGDLTKSEDRFKSWAKGMEDSAVGWQGIVGRVPSEQQLLEAFRKKDLVIYIGHGGAEQYVRSNKIKHLPRCAATMLWGCSSGLMRNMGDFDRTGTPYNYMMAGCPTLVACLWDVTDNELDKFSRSVFEKLRLDVEHVKSWNPESTSDKVSLVAAVGQSRDVCKLKYLTGAAPVVYGIPFYL